MQGDIKNAENLYRQAIKTGLLHEAIFSNLGVICKNSARQEEAIALYKKAIGINPNDSNAQANLGNLYRELGNLDLALAYTLKALELKPDNPTALMNLGGFYKDLGNLDKAREETLQSLELKPDNPGSLNNLKVLIDQLTLSPTNAQHLTKAYELLISLDNISHQKLSKAFIQAFLASIQEAAKADPSSQ